MSTPLHILIVDDSSDDAALIVLTLKRARYLPMWERVDSAGTLTAALGKRQGWDVITCASTMPNFHCASALHIVRALAPGTPFIVVSDAVEAAHAAEIFRKGVSAIVRKGELQELPATIARTVNNRTSRS